MCGNWLESDDGVEEEHSHTHIWQGLAVNVRRTHWRPSIGQGMYIQANVPVKSGRRLSRDDDPAWKKGSLIKKNKKTWRE